LTWRPDDPQGEEARKVVWDVVQYLRGTVLDLGCGPRKVLPHVVGVDSCVDTELFGIQIQPDLKVKDCADLGDFESAAVDAVFSSHLLEHIVDTEAALKEWWRVLKPNGHLVLYLPHRDHYPRIGTPGANPDHKHDFTPEDVLGHIASVAASSQTGMDVVINETRTGGMEYSFLLVVQKLAEIDCRATYKNPRPEKTACVFRAGGFGDMIQAANIFPELKRQGYHVTVVTTPGGHDIVREDPHIDDFVILDPDLVPNHELPLYWEALAKRYDKFVQLSESVEGTLLAMPGRANHMWPQAVRQVVLNKNYLEWTSYLAELPYYSEARFYPTAEEAGKARGFLTAIQLARRPQKDLMIGMASPKVFTIMWALAGSSVHKFTPHMDAVVARILTDIPEAVIILTGDEACQILECGWELEPRVYRESGKMGIRDTLALAQKVDLVIGPETGVLNAVAFEEDVAKVIMLSHSSKENLTKHWFNTRTLAPAGTSCYPCHRLHYGRAYCNIDEATGAAKCQVDITPAAIFDEVEAVYHEWKE
jgi:ADP-heptose:LPS heptosyltransferase/predicted SAM-dependent methyltransferase